jgi:hypothetical protein
MNFTPEQLRKLKPKFDKLTYTEKLLFWDKHFWNKEKDFFFGFHWSYFFNEVDTEEEHSKPENSITIYPSNGKENEMCNIWLFNHIQSEPHYNFEKQKEKYFEKIKNNPRPIEFIESEIALIIIQRDKEKKLMEGKSDIFVWGYYYGYQSVVQNVKRPPVMEANKFNRIILSYTKGVCDAYYLGFLEQQLEAIRQGNKALLLKNDKPKGEDITIEQVYEIFNSIDLNKELLREKMLRGPYISMNKDTFNSDVRILLTQILEQYKAQTSRLNNENKLAHLQERLKPLPKTTKVVTSKFEGEMEQVHSTIDALLNKFYTAEFNLIAPDNNPVQLPTNQPDIPKERILPNKTAFKYKKKGASDQTKIANLRSNLIDKCLIAEATPLMDFKKIFRNELPTEPIKWTGTLSELYYFIKQMHLELKLIEDLGNEIWKITANCFVSKDGNKYDYAKFRLQKAPANTSQLDKILSNL